MNYQNLLWYFIAGLIAISLIATIGAVASRKFGFKYSGFIVLSLIIYISLGYFISIQFEFRRVVLVNGLLGLYDGTVGFWLSIKLGANTGLTDEQLAEIKGKPVVAVMMVIIAITLAALGYGLGKI